MQLSLVFPPIVSSSPRKFFSAISFLRLGGASKKGFLQPKHLSKPYLGARLHGRGRNMAELNQASALEEEGDAVLRDGSLDSLSNSSFRIFESALNKSSKWLVAGLFGLMILWKHDAEVLWAATGSILNSWISITLKRILNHERPSGLRSDPGMPSSHAQAIFYVSIFALLSLIQWLGVNILTMLLGAAILGSGSYFSWLRVSLHLHTKSQVLVGAFLGTVISIAWFYFWHAFVYYALVSSIWVRIIVVFGSVSLCAAFVIYVIRNWLDDERI